MMSAENVFRDVLTDEGQLRAVLGHPTERVILKARPTLDAHCRAFIARSPFLLLATASAAGQCDVSPKGDPAGFVTVLDDRHLAIPDRPGNKRLDGMRNILENPHVGLIFIVPGREDTLRVNGRAWIVRDADVLARMAVQGKTPTFAVGVEVEEVFLHCAKALKRAGLWAAAATEACGAGLPSMAQMLWDQVPVKPAFATVEEYEADQQRRLQSELY